MPTISRITGFPGQEKRNRKPVIELPSRPIFRNTSPSLMKGTGQGKCISFTHRGKHGKRCLHSCFARARLAVGVISRAPENARLPGYPGPGLVTWCNRTTCPFPKNGYAVRPVFRSALPRGSWSYRSRLARCTLQQYYSSAGPESCAGPIISLAPCSPSQAGLVQPGNCAFLACVVLSFFNQYPIGHTPPPLLLICQ